MFHARPEPLAHAEQLLETASCEALLYALMAQPNLRSLTQCLSGSFTEEDIK